MDKYENFVFTEENLDKFGIHDLRTILRDFGGTPTLKKKDEIIKEIVEIRSGKVAVRSGRGRKAVKKVEEEYAKDDFSSTQVSEDETQTDNTDTFNVSGLLEIMPDGYGFLRGENYESNGLTDIHVSKNTIKYFKLRKGDFVVGVAQKTESSPSLKAIKTINGYTLRQLVKRPYFDDLTPCYPDEKIKLEYDNGKDDLSIRAIDILCPIGKGQRGLIVAPPKAGKTTLLKKIAKSIELNYPKIKLIILLIDERPEEVTDLKRSCNAEIIYSTFDESPENHVRASENVLNRAKRLVECGEDVVILLDSITKLTRAHNTIIPSSGKTLSGGIDPVALQAPKKFFGSARNIEDGGSLTILATALVETGSKMDDVIYEEFKGTGNMEIILSRELSERRVFPAIDLYRSGTRKDELLLSEKEMDCAYQIRKYFVKNENASEFLLEMLAKTSDNQEFVEKAPVWCKTFTK
ncbi:MAG: transcription termination factor Rho [Clostridia bacterium]|nr:transcription termination factor Rho [Clostridia bacterium]